MQLKMRPKLVSVVCGVMPILLRRGTSDGANEHHDVLASELGIFLEMLAEMRLRPLCVSGLVKVHATT